MGSVRTMMGAGLPAASAVAIGVGTTAVGLTAAGSTVADAFAITADSNLFTTTASGTGAKLPDVEVGSVITVYNGGANALLVYPPTGGQIQNKTATTGTMSIATLKGGEFKRLSAIHWGGITD